MAVASGRAGRVLARPNVHVRTLNTRDVLRVRTSKVKPSRLVNWLPNIVQISLTRRCVRIMAIPYCDEASAACGTCTQLSSYAESEITSLVPSNFPSFAIRTASGGKLGRTLGTRLSIQYSM